MKKLAKTWGVQANSHILVAKDFCCPHKGCDASFFCAGDVNTPAAVQWRRSVQGFTETMPVDNEPAGIVVISCCKCKKPFQLLIKGTTIAAYQNDCDIWPLEQGDHPIKRIPDSISMFVSSVRTPQQQFAFM